MKTMLETMLETQGYCAWSTLTATLVLRPSSTSSLLSSFASPSSSRQVVLDVTWSDPHGGKLTETFEVDKTGNKMTQTSKILVNEDATTGTCHTPVFLRVSKGGNPPPPPPPPPPLCLQAAPRPDMRTPHALQAWPGYSALVVYIRRVCQSAPTCANECVFV